MRMMGESVKAFFSSFLLDRLKKKRDDGAGERERATTKEAPLADATKGTPFFFPLCRRLPKAGQQRDPERSSAPTVQGNGIMDDTRAAAINAALPPEILYEVLLFVGHGRMPCLARMVCRWWRDVTAGGGGGGDRDARLLRAPEALDLLGRGEIAAESFVARAARTMTLVAPPGGDCAVVFRHLCAVLGRAGRWQDVVVLVERTPRALDEREFAAVASGAAACIGSDDALGRAAAANARCAWVCAGLCGALASGDAAATVALCARLGACEHTCANVDCANAVVAATTAAARRGHVDAVLAQTFCPALNVSLLWDSIVRSRDAAGFAKLVETVRGVGPDAMASARYASWTTRLTAHGGPDNSVRSVALGWYGGAWVGAAAAAGWAVPFDLATDKTDDMALARDHPYRVSASSLWTEAAALATRHGHVQLAARLTAAAAP